MVKLDVPVISQLPELPTGCEITAITMMLQYKDINVDKVQLANEMPRHAENPNLGYVGDPFTPDGWTIYPAALIDMVENYSESVHDLTGKQVSDLEKQLANDKPVVVLVSGMHDFTVHAITLTGYDEENFYYNDPWTEKKDAKMNRNIFIKNWEGQKRRALTF